MGIVRQQILIEKLGALDYEVPLYFLFDNGHLNGKSGQQNESFLG